MCICIAKKIKVKANWEKDHTNVYHDVLFCMILFSLTSINFRGNTYSPQYFSLHLFMNNLWVIRDGQWFHNFISKAAIFHSRLKERFMPDEPRTEASPRRRFVSFRTAASEYQVLQDLKVSSILCDQSISKSIRLINQRDLA